MKQRYFDHNATTPLAPAARDAWLAASQDHWLNPSSPYRAAAAVRVRYEAARGDLAARFSIAPERVVFTSGATESNNMVMRHWAEGLPADGLVAVNSTEHPSVIAAARALLGPRIHWLDLTADGRVELAALEAGLRSRKFVAVSVMAANNETGVIQPWQEIAELCAQAQVPYHCDASQWVGKMPLDGLGACHYVTACAHKFGGVKGVGFLLLPNPGDACCSLFGGAQEAGHRAGTEDVAGVFAMLAALEHASTGDPTLKGRFLDAVVAAIPELTVVGGDAPCLWNTVSIILPKFQSTRWIRALEKAGFLVSAGSACSTGSGKAAASPVLQAMGVSAAAAGRALRISSGCETTADDWDALAAAIADTYRSLTDEAHSSQARVISID
jgi:cysteine desulfurase